MRGLRTGAAVAVVASTLALTSPPASAATAIAFEGTIEIGCYGCGWYGPDGNSARFRATGVIRNEIIDNVEGWLSFRNYSRTGATCVVDGFFDGDLEIHTPLSQDIHESFTVPFTGPVGLMNFWVADWRGVLTFKVTSPVGNPCGAGVTASFAGELVGA